MKLAAGIRESLEAPAHTHTHTFSLSHTHTHTDAELIKTVHTRRRCKFQGLGEEEDVRVWSEKVTFGVADDSDGAEWEMKSFQYLPLSLPPSLHPSRPFGEIKQKGARGSLALAPGPPTVSDLFQGRPGPTRR